MKKRNVTITGLSEAQYEWLREEAKGKALTMTSVIKVLIEEKIEDGKNGKR